MESHSWYVHICILELWLLKSFINTVLLDTNIFKQIYLTPTWDSNKYYHFLLGGSGSNEGVLNTLKVERNEESPPDAVLCYTQDTHFVLGGLNPFLDKNS